MHRMTMHLPTPSTSWDRKLDEATLFELTLNKYNVEETDKFIEILDQEAETYFEYMYNKAVDDFEAVHQLLNSKDSTKVSEGMRSLNGIITRAPYDSPVLPNAIKLRGNCFFHKCCFEAASMDFEMFLHIGSKTNDAEEMCEVNGNLVITNYLNRQYQKSKQCLKIFNDYRAVIPKNNLKNPNLERIIRHISNFADELDNVEDIVPKCLDDVGMCIPYKGFNTSGDIPNTSATLKKCLFGNYTGIFSNCSIPAGAVVLVEHPVVQGVDIPFAHCELCLQYKPHIYTCFKCRYKTYCSLKCMLKDTETHRNECEGYKNILLLTLDAISLYKVFMRVSALLHEHIFDLKVFRFTTAAAVLEKLQKIIEKRNLNGMQYLNHLRTKPDYYNLSGMQYSTLITTAFRLTIFIEKKTNVIDSFYKKLRLSNKQKMIVIGAILMRLNFHLIANTFDFELKYPGRLKSVRYQSMQQQIKLMSSNVQPIRGGKIDVYNYYNVNIEDDIVKKRVLLFRKHHGESVKSNTEQMNGLCNPILRQLSTYKDEIAELYFKLKDSKDSSLFDNESGMPIVEQSGKIICKRINKLSELERYKFVQVFARCFHRYLAEYFMQKKDNYLIQVITFLCTTLGKFRHSCDPNLEVSVMENGIVVGKTLREINNGEELFVSYKAHYTRHTKAERKKYLQQLNLNCKCRYCEVEDIHEPINVRLGIFCDCCNVKIITPANGKCVICQKTYNHLLSKYITESNIIIEELNAQTKLKANERELYIIHLMSYIYVSQYFVPSNEIRIRIELKYAKFLALKNFGKESFSIVQEVKQTLLNDYHKSFIWFSLYADIIDILKILLYYNMNKGIHSISNTDLEHICDYGLFIIKGQLNCIRLYETFDYESAPIYHDLYTFKEWRDKIWLANFCRLGDSTGFLKLYTKRETVPKSSKAIFIK